MSKTANDELDAPAIDLTADSDTDDARLKEYAVEIRSYTSEVVLVESTNEHSARGIAEYEAHCLGMENVRAIRAEEITTENTNE